MRDAAALLTAKHLIAARLSSPELDSSWLCARLQVSRATLYRLFKNLGGVSGFIRDQRLDRIAEALVSAGPAVRVAELAECWGFSDASHLSRVFRERFGVPPGAYRASSVTMESGPTA